MIESEERDQDDRHETKASENDAPQTDAPTDVRWGTLDDERWGDSMSAELSQ